MEDAMLFLLCLCLVAAVFGVAYKYRVDIHRWLHDPKCGSTWTPDRKVILQRRIEDATAEMAWLEEKRAGDTDEPETGGG